MKMTLILDGRPGEVEEVIGCTLTSLFPPRTGRVLGALGIMLTGDLEMEFKPGHVKVTLVGEPIGPLG